MWGKVANMQVRAKDLFRVKCSETLLFLEDLISLAKLAFIVITGWCN